MSDDLTIDLAPPSESELRRLTEERRGHLEEGIAAVRSLVEEEREKYSKLCAARRRREEDPPPPDLPRAESSNWVDQAATNLANKSVPDWFADDDLRAVGEDFTSRELAELRALPECKPIATEVITLRWTRRPVLRKDLLLDETRCGRVKVVPEAERLTWAGQGPAPSFRFELSLPWFLLAEHHEVMRGLHDLLAYCGMSGGKPKLRKPDISAHAVTLARFGIAGIREARAVAHAVAHPQHRALMEEHHYDPVTRQGLIWPDLETHQRRSGALFPAPERATTRALDQLAKKVTDFAHQAGVTPEAVLAVARAEVERRRVGKDAAAEPREPEFTADPDDELEH